MTPLLTKNDIVIIHYKKRVIRSTVNLKTPTAQKKKKMNNNNDLSKIIY